MADMKSKQQEQRDGQVGDHKEQEAVDFALENGNAPREESSSDGTSNHGSVGGTSMDDDLVTPEAIAAAAQSQNAKKGLSKQPSNGIHILKVDGLSVTANGPPPLPNPDTAQNGHVVSQQGKDEEIIFDPDGPYYMANACCELLHYRKAAILVGVIEIFMIAAWVAVIAYYYTAIGGVYSIGSKAAVGSQAVLAAGFLIVIILMFIGVATERPVLLWPHMIVQIFGIVLGISFTVIAVIAMCAGTSLAEAIFSFFYGAHNLPKVEAALGPIWPFCLAVIFDFGAALGIWFYVVIKGCYEYLMDKVFFEKEMNHGRNLALKKETFDAAAKKAS